MTIDQRIAELFKQADDLSRRITESQAQEGARQGQAAEINQELSWFAEQHPAAYDRIVDARTDAGIHTFTDR